MDTRTTQLQYKVTNHRQPGDFMQKKVFFKNKHKERLCGILHLPQKVPAPAVIVCHGFTSSKVKKEEWCEFLSKKGFVALRFDFSGCGESQGDFKDFTVTKCLDDTRAAVEFLKKKKLSMGIGMAGTSLGGNVLMIYAALNKIDAAVPIAAPFRLDDTEIMRDKEAMKSWKETGFRYYAVRAEGWKRKKKPLNYNFITDRQKYDMGRLSKKIKCPVLVIHGDKDDVVPVTHSQLYYRNIKSQKKLIVIKGADHSIGDKIQDLNMILKEMNVWFSKYLKE